MLREKLVNALEWTEAVNDGFLSKGIFGTKLSFAWESKRQTCEIFSHLEFFLEQEAMIQIYLS